ncbi:hypothetical protein CYLTODRAFT_444924 [Cylindrobasidium torrendii FP15055 ss-10]|uniref:Uncharacterized protein n=1 Tax=Cylindrobasidium torrendii FP15055 ss-10 TaxID=1314674 RepID=A0A0D7B685_9AGAR|nr:hypothetical protein CYLTODRAFT_444924 [Cylindrobasidium torrendii FP15055 ss-10]
MTRILCSNTNFLLVGKRRQSSWHWVQEAMLAVDGGAAGRYNFCFRAQALIARNSRIFGFFHVAVVSKSSFGVVLTTFHDDRHPNVQIALRWRHSRLRITCFWTHQQVLAYLAGEPNPSIGLDGSNLATFSDGTSNRNTKPEGNQPGKFRSTLTAETLATPAGWCEVLLKAPYDVERILALSGQSSPRGTVNSTRLINSSLDVGNKTAGIQFGKKQRMWIYRLLSFSSLATSTSFNSLAS